MFGPTVPVSVTAGHRYYVRARATDQTGNVGAYADSEGFAMFTFDDTPPTAMISVAITQTQQTSFTVSWSANDPAPSSGLTAYDVQYRIGENGMWTDWITGTASMSATFGPAQPVTVTAGNRYYVRAQATDQAGNTGAYSDAAGVAVYTFDDVPPTHPAGWPSRRSRGPASRRAASRGHHCSARTASSSARRSPSSSTGPWAGRPTPA